MNLREGWTPSFSPPNFRSLLTGPSPVKPIKVRRWPHDNACTGWVSRSMPRAPHTHVFATQAKKSLLRQNLNIRWICTATATWFGNDVDVMKKFQRLWTKEKEFAAAAQGL